MRCVRRTQFSREEKSFKSEQADSALTDVPQYRERERERMGLWKHAGHPPPPPSPPPPHEFSYSSDAVQERSARTSTALTY